MKFYVIGESMKGVLWNPCQQKNDMIFRLLLLIYSLKQTNLFGILWFALMNRLRAFKNHIKALCLLTFYYCFVCVFWGLICFYIIGNLIRISIFCQEAGHRWLTKEPILFCFTGSTLCGQQLMRTRAKTC